MAPPSYARATASSALKANPNSPSKTKDANTPASTPKKLKRPSILTPQHRQSISYKADLYPIHPQDPSKPCGLATLPSELRTAIYEYALGLDIAGQQPRSIFKPRFRGIRYIWPKILHISRAIRIEAAYVYYTTTPFIFFIRNFSFSKVTLWLDQIPPRHRALLTRNRNLSVKVMPGLRPSHTYPPQGWLLDGWMENHWEACSMFGNIYTISSARHQTHFILFCRLMSWFQNNATMPYRDMMWKYDVDHGFQGSIWGQREDAKTLWRFLSEEVGVLGMSYVAKAWTRNRIKGKGKEEALNFLSDLNEASLRVGIDKREDLMETWAAEMRRLNTVVSKW